MTHPKNAKAIRDQLTTLVSNGIRHCMLGKARPYIPTQCLLPSDIEKDQASMAELKKDRPHRRLFNEFFFA